MPSTIGYAALCIVVPVLWGLLIYAITNWLERRILPLRKRVPSETALDPGDTLPVEYHI